METFPFSVSGNYTIIVGGPRTMVSECVVQGVGSKRKKKIGKNRTVLYTECSQGSTVDVVCSSKGFLFAYKFNPRRSWYTLYCSARSTNFYSDPSAQRAPAHTTYSVQGRRKVWKLGEGGIFCHLVWIGLTERTVARAQPTFTHQPNVHQLTLHTLQLSPGP